MTRDEITAGLAEILEEVAGVNPDDVAEEKSFTDDLDVDSLSMVEVVVAAEEKFGVKIPDNEVQNLKTVGDAVTYIEANVLTMSRPDVVVTGLGATTPLGGDVASTWDAMLAGRSGVGPLTQEWAAQLPVRIAAQLAVEPTEVLDRVKLRRLDRSEAIALIAAHAGVGRRRPRRLRPRPGAAGRQRRLRHRRRARPCSPRTTSWRRPARAGSPRTPSRC